MGNSIGVSHWFAPHLRGYPDCELESKYEPLFGFPNGRKQRVMIATEAEMDSARLVANERDYCAHKLIKLKACRRDEAPFYGRCHDYKHDYEHCEYLDQVMRMKEYEREKRLDDRQKRILARQRRESM
ncbi:NADH dehydrogenase [ubiquinone] 1 beta subcomplex subunit 7 [Halotydeus destructor]|nr:NADH dehydrogenase [ubiquinone] 1 beta subcomplex subunit 7 [Halotydeus destructor]